MNILNNQNLGKAGSLFIVSAPSGAGKSSLVNALLQRIPGIALSISTTTRDPRPGEKNGREYHFVSVEEFEAAKERNEFLETALVHGNYYGTSKAWIEQQMTAGSDVLLEIDYQGAQQVRNFFPDAISIFILPPSIQSLEDRLHKRGQDSEVTIAKRLLGAGAEMAHASDFDFVIINEDFDTALNEFCAVVTSSRLRYKKQAVRCRNVFVQLGVPTV